ncbi:MAG: hypothetical protein HQL91_01980 [Magnetococcales bacterium]|nr:hypothetical protein [Magnetococcales bacterium]
MLQLIPYGLAAVVGGLLGKKYFPILTDQALSRSSSQPELLPTATSSSIQFLGETVVREDSIVLATEEVPLDNRHGNKVLSSEHEFTRTANIRLEVGQQMAQANQFKGSIWMVLESMVQKELKRNLQIEFGTQITRRVKITFSTDPGFMVRYRLIWKQTSRRGFFDVRVGAEKHVIPYLVTFGLYHAVESLAEGGDGGT